MYSAFYANCFGLDNKSVEKMKVELGGSLKADS
jgi:hypothetical protein